jgi:hypothetical protein
MAGEAESQLRVPKAEVGRRPRRICPEKRGHGAADEENAAGSLQLGEFLEWFGQPFDRRFTGQEQSLLALLHFVRGWSISCSVTFPSVAPANLFGKRNRCGE